MNSWRGAASPVLGMRIGGGPEQRRLPRLGPIGPPRVRHRGVGDLRLSRPADGSTRASRRASSTAAPASQPRSLDDQASAATQSAADRSSPSSTSSGRAHHNRTVVTLASIHAEIRVFATPLADRQHDARPLRGRDAVTVDPRSSASREYWTPRSARGLWLEITLDVQAMSTGGLHAT